MNKKWLWYVCAVLLCCGSLAFYSYATQSDSAKRLSPQAQKSLAQAKRELAQQGRFDEIDAKIQSLSSMNNEVKAPAQVQRVDGPSVSAEAPAGYVAPAAAEVVELDAREQLKIEAERLLDEITRLSMQGLDFTYQKQRLSEIVDQLDDGRMPNRPLDQGGETCATAVVINSLPYCDPGTTVGAIDDYGCTTNPQYGPDVVYAYTPTVTEQVTVSLCGGTTYDSRIIVSQGCPTAGGVNVLCNDDYCSLQSCGTVTMTAGLTYYIIVDAYSTGTGPYVIKVTNDGICNTATTCPGAIGRCCYNGGASCADNTQAECTTLGGMWTPGLTCAANPCPTVIQGSEDCANRVSLPIGQQIEGTTAGYAIDNVPTCSTILNTAPGVWYSVIGNGTTLTATTCLDPAGSPFQYDTKLGVFCGTCDNLVCITGNDDNCSGVSGLYSTVTWCSAPGQEYFLLVTGFSTASGIFDLLVTSGAACNDPIGCSVELGRCCYNDGASCANNIAATCAGLNGIWTPDLTCEEEPCVNLCAMECSGTDVIEPDDFPNYCATNGTSDINGGCNLVPPVYGSIACGQTVCAQTFTCDATGYRDTDWFLFTITEFSDVTLTAQSSFSNLLFGIVDITNCASAFFITNSFITNCALGPQSVSALQLAPGSYVAFGSYGNFTGLPTPSLYKLTLTCTPAGEPQGRCCYDNNSSCIDNTLTECTALGGNWTQGLTCAGSPCPPPPPTNDDCNTATLMVVPPMGSASAAAGNPAATHTCVGQSCVDDCFYGPSTGPDQFYYFTLTECRRIAILGDNDVFCDPNIVVYDGACCGTQLYCNEDWGCNPDLDLIPWLDPSFRPVAGFGSMIAGLFNPGTYYIRAGHYGSGNSGVYTLSIYDFGPCQDAPCDPVTDLTILVESAGNLPNNYKLFFTAPQDEDYTIWYSNNPNNDGNPDDGSDPDFAIADVLLGVMAGPVVYQALPGFDNYRYFVVTAGCSPFTEPVGRCCYNNNNNCDDLTQADCAELGGTWGGPFQSCGANPCPPPLPTGRCCYNGGLDCVDNFQTECAALGGQWNEFLTCATDQCPLLGPNDECIGAVQVFNNTPVSGTTVGSTFSPQPTTCIFTVPDVWYVYTSTSTSPITMSLCDNGTNYDTKMGCYAASCDGTEVFCIDDSACPINGLYTIGTVATPSNGTNYYIRVSGFGGQTGDFVLLVTQ